ncbi:hypothetical protein J4E91_009656 [Alternaria rosae]|nr:hypothetical protein J4E91_009656 [Alternaria rosae]
MGLPLGLPDDDIDVCFPLTEHHQQARVDPCRELHLLHLVAQQARLRGEIIELRNKSLHYVQNDPDRATSIIAKLGQWWNDVENYIEPDSRCGASPYATVVLTLLRHELIISLYRPVLATGSKDVAYNAALQQCISSARSIINTLHTAIQGKNGPQMNHDQLALLWPSCTWAVWISTFIMFYAAHEDRIDHSVVTRYDSEVAGDAALAQKDELNVRSSLHEQSLPTCNDEPDQIGRQRRDDIALPHDAQYPPYNAAFDSSATSNLNHDATLPEHNSYWNIFLGTEGADASSIEYSNGLDPFSGFDIPFWFDQEQHWDFT